MDPKRICFSKFVTLSWYTAQVNRHGGRGELINRDPDSCNATTEDLQTHTTADYLHPNSI